MILWREEDVLSYFIFHMLKFIHVRNKCINSLKNTKIAKLYFNENKRNC